MKGSLPIHKYIHDVYKSLSLTTHNTHNTHNPYVYGIGEKKHHRIFGGAFTFVGDIGIINVILFVLYVLSWYAIREATEDFIRNGGGEGCNFKGRDAFMTLRTQ